MPSPVPYLIYLFGPLLLALGARRILGSRFAVFSAGLLTFLLAWICVMIVTQISAAATGALAQGTVLYTVLVATAAGVFEESGRYLAFKTFRSLRASPGWRSGLMYAVGHSGMESVIVGGSLVLTVLVVTRAPDALSPELLGESRKLLETGAGAAVYGAVERLFVGLLVHATFTMVVVLSIVRSDRRFLAVAIAWHFAHDMIAQNLLRVSQHWMAHAGWIVFIVVLYSFILVHLVRSVGQSCPGGTPLVPAGGAV